jgi:hypothetical protein
VNRFQSPIQVLQQAQTAQAVEIVTEHDNWLAEFDFVPLPDGEEIPRLVFV